jgi:hypothetical protein
VDWILVKAICDWADGQKEHDRPARQKLAAKNAARFVLHVLQQAPVQREKKPAKLPAARRPGGRQESAKVSVRGSVTDSVIVVGNKNVVKTRKG